MAKQKDENVNNSFDSEVKNNLVNKKTNSQNVTDNTNVNFETDETKIKSKKPRRVLFFILGCLTGLVVMSGIFVGVCFYFYNNFNLNQYNSLFHTEYSTGYDDLDKMPFKQIASHMFNLIDVYDDYTLLKLEQDFGLVMPNSILGVDVTDLKASKFKDFEDSLKNKFKNLNLNDLENLSQTDIDNLLNKEVVYFVNGNKIYRDEGYAEEVEFDYSIDGDDVLINNLKISTIGNNNKTTINLSKLPITSAINEFSINIDKVLKINEVFDDDSFNSGVLSLLSATDQGKNISQLPLLIVSNLKSKNLSMLKQAGIIDIDNQSLNKRINVNGSQFYGETLGSLTLDNIIEILLKVST